MQRLSFFSALFQPHLHRQPGGSLVTATVVIVLAYLALVRSLRFRRLRCIQKRYGLGPTASGVLPQDGTTPTRAKLTPAEAQEIIHVSLQYDLPGVILYATNFALFKTYSIVSTGTNDL